MKRLIVMALSVTLSLAGVVVPAVAQDENVTGIQPMPTGRM